MVLSITCIWLIVDAAVGKGYVNNFLASIFPFMLEDEKEPLTEEETETKSANAPSSAAISGVKNNSSDKITDADIEAKFGGSRVWTYYENNTVPYSPAQQVELDKLREAIAKYRVNGGK